MDGSSPDDTRQQDDDQCANRRDRNLVAPRSEIEWQVQQARLNHRAADEGTDDADDQVAQKPATTKQLACEPTGDDTVHRHDAMGDCTERGDSAY